MRNSLLLVVLIGCGSMTGDQDGPGGGGDACMYQDRWTQFASCTDDSDC